MIHPVHIKLINKDDGNSSIEDVSDISGLSGLSGETDHLNPMAAASHDRQKRRRSTAINEKFGVFLSPWGKNSFITLQHIIIHICQLHLTHVCLCADSTFSEKKLFTLTFINLHTNDKIMS